MLSIDVQYSRRNSLLIHYLEEESNKITNQLVINMLLKSKGQTTNLQAIVW